MSDLLEKNKTAATETGNATVGKTKSTKAKPTTGKQDTGYKEKLAGLLHLGPPPTQQELDATVAKEKDKEKFKKAKKDAHDLPKYEALLEEARDARDLLEKMPAAAPQLKIVSDAIAKATGEAKSDNYTTARATLEAAKISAQLKEGQKQDGLVQKEARKNFPDAYAAADKLRNEALGSEVLADGERKDFAAKADAAVGKLLPDALVKDGLAAEVTLDTLQQKLTGRIAACGAAKTRAEVALAKAEKFAAKERATLPIDVAVEFDQHMKQAKTQFGEREYETAAEAADALLQWADEAAAKVTTDWDEWAKRLGSPEKKGKSRPSILPGPDSIFNPPPERGTGRPSIMPGPDSIFNPPSNEQSNQPPTPRDQPKKFGETDIDGLIKRAQALVDQAAEVPVLSTAPPKVSGTLGRLQRLKAATLDAQIGVTMSAGDAVKEFDACKDEIALNDARVLKYKALDAARQSAQQDVDQQVTYLRNALKNLAENAKPFVAQGVNIAKVIDPFTKRFEALKADWARRKETAIDDKELGAAEIVKKLRDLREEVRAKYKTDDVPNSLKDVVVGGNVQALVNDSQKRDLDAAIQDCAPKIDKIVAISVDYGTKAASRYEAVKAAAAKATAAGDVAKCLADIKTLAGQLDEWIEGASGAGEAARESIKPQLDEAQNLLKTFETAITKAEKEDDYGGMRDRFAGELAEQRLLAKSSDESILEGVGKALVALIANITKASNALSGKDDSGAKVPTIKDVRKSIEKRKKLVGVELLTLYLVGQQAELRDELDTIAEDVDARLPEETSSLLTDWDAKLETAKRDAEKAKKAHDELVEGAAGLQAKLKEDVFKNAKGYRDALAAKLQACLDKAREDGNKTAAMKTLHDLDAEINAAASDPNALQKGEQDAQEIKRKAAIDAEEWKSRVSVFNKRVQEVTAWRSKERAELEDMVKSANKKFEMTGDLAAARKQLTGAERRADYYEKYPEGQDTAVRSTLPKVVEAWRKAVGDMKKSMDEVLKGVNAIPDLDNADKKVVETEIGLLKGMFNPAAFDKTASMMTEKGRDKNEMRGVREVALREVGQMLALLQSDLRCQTLADKNPFSTGMRGAIVAARLALLKVEYTLMTSL